MPTKALHLNTGDKTKSKYSPQKKTQLKTVQVMFNVAGSGLIDGTSVKPCVIG